MFITTVFVLFLIKLPWPKNSFTERAYFGPKERANMLGIRSEMGNEKKFVTPSTGT